MLVSINVIPDAKKNTVTEVQTGKFQVTLKAKAERGEANDMLKLALAEYFKIPVASVRIVTGFHGSHKRVEIMTDSEKV